MKYGNSISRCDVAAWNFRSEENLLVARRRVEPRQVIHYALLARHRRLLHHEIRKFNLQVRRRRLELQIGRKPPCGTPPRRTAPGNPLRSSCPTPAPASP